MVTSDIVHYPQLVGDNWVCSGCGMSLPDSIVFASGGLGVVEVGGALVPADPTTMGVACTHPGVAAQRKLSDECLSVAQHTTSRLRREDDEPIGPQIILTPDPSQFGEPAGLDPVRAAALGLTEGRVSSF